MEGLFSGGKFNWRGRFFGRRFFGKELWGESSTGINREIFIFGRIETKNS